MGDEPRASVSSDPPSRSLSTVPGPKRRQVAAACQRCRQRKTKCDGNRPCQFCSRRNLECIFVTEENETRQHAAKRRYHELTQTRDTHELLLSILTGPDETVALDAFRRMRAGEDFEQIVQSILPSTAPSDRQGSSSENYQQLLILLLQSTAALTDILDIFRAIANKSLLFRFFDRDVNPPRDMILKSSFLRQILEPVSALPPALRAPDSHLSLSSSHERPLHWAPASPWTRLTDDDETASHLVSIFLTLINPYWRMVEEELFLRDLRARREDAIYCSEALVNAILALASLYTEINAAFVSPGDLLSRGEHFHNEAVRLCERDDRPSVVNMQALLVLGTESSLRGRDTLGWSFISKAHLLNSRLPMPEMKADMTGPMKTYVVARRCVAAATSWCHATFVVGLLLDPDQHGPAPDGDIVLDDLFPDAATFWVAYPFLTKSIPLHANLLLQERGRLATFIRQSCQLFFSEDSRSGSDLWLEQVTDLAARFETWLGATPSFLSYHAEAPYALHEFHAQCRCVRMTIYDWWHQGLVVREDRSKATQREDSGTSRNAIWEKAQWVACDVAASLRDFRWTYGYKTAPPFMIQQTALAMFLLLRHLQEGTHPQTTEPRFVAINQSRSGPDIAPAIEECFRGLAGIGVQQLAARGLARMVHHTALELKVRLPQTVEEMQEIIGDAIWSPSDLQQIRSRYPNLALGRQPGAEIAEVGMEVLLHRFEAQSLQDRKS